MSLGRRGVSRNKEKPSAQSYGLVRGGGKHGGILPQFRREAHKL